MTLRQYLILMSLGTFLCFAAFGFVVWTLSPESAGFVGFLFFYVSLFLAILGTFSVMGFIAKQRFAQSEEVVFRHVKKTFRQGTLFASFIVLLLFLRQIDFLNWWIAVLVLLLFLFLEGIIFTNKKYNKRNYV